MFYATRFAKVKLSGKKDYRTWLKNDKEAIPAAQLVRADGSTAPLYLVNPLTEDLALLKPSKK